MQLTGKKPDYDVVLSGREYTDGEGNRKNELTNVGVAWKNQGSITIQLKDNIAVTGKLVLFEKGA